MVEQIVVAIFQKVAEKLVDPIVHQFSYLFNHRSNIKNLTNGVQNLLNEKDGVKLLVDAAKRNLQIIGPDIEAWLSNVEEIEIKAREVLEGGNIVKDGCMNLKKRYMQSKKAVKQTVVVNKLRKDREKHTQLSYPALPPSMVVSTSTTGFEVFESRISQTKQIIEALKNKNISKIGICGLGGVGKTRMAKEIREITKVENLFDEVVMVVVSQNHDMKKIQDQLASMLGLELGANNNIDDRGARLSERLRQGKRILVILDDVWKEVDLRELGIPLVGNDECNVLIISRNKHVCDVMGTQKNFSIELLSDQEAWDLFKEKAGDCVETVNIRPIAEEIVNECGCLPLAIVTVGTALKGREIYAWEDALRQLKMSTATSIDGMETNVYSSLRLSYDYLKRNQKPTSREGSSQLQRLFLLCCLFPEDYDISIEELVRYAIGLRLFKDVVSLASARCRVQSLADQLKTCYLLLASDKKGHVKMHDIIRDFGLIEASSGENVYMVRHDAELKEWPQNDEVKSFTAISIGSKEKLELPPGLECPSLQLLQLSSEGSTQISGDYFGEMKDLRVVSFYGQSINFDPGNMLLESPSKALQFFMNVRTLCLESCSLSTNIRLIGSMHKLEILSFIYSKIDVLPNELGQLNNLKLLDLRGCIVGIIPSGVLACLTKLEDLYMGDYFHGVGVEERNQGNCARITELYSLSHLKTLQVYVSEIGLLLKLKDFFFDKLTRFNIQAHRSEYSYFSYEFQNSVDLAGSVDLSLLLGTKFDILLRRTEVLKLRHAKGWKNMIRESDEDGFTNLKKLFIFGNDDLVEICHAELPASSMGRLEEVELHNLSVMTHLWRGPVQLPSLGDLKVVHIEGCHAIKCLFQASVVRCLVQLRKLEVCECQMLEEIVTRDEKDVMMIEFPKLNEVELLRLPSLRSFVSVADIIGPHNNRYSTMLNQVSLPSLETLVFSRMNAVKLLGGEIQHDSLYKLRVLELYRCKKMRCVAEFDSIKSLKNLEKLGVHSCTSMETLFDLESFVVTTDEQILEKLDSIVIDNLYELRNIWKNVPKHGFQGFQNLTVLKVDSCNKLKYLLSLCTAKLLVNLQVMEVGYCDMIEQVIKMDEGEKEMEKIVFPQFRNLHLDHLRNLTAFCEGSHDLEFQSLEKASIRKCPNMTKFCSGSLSTQKLEFVELDDDSFWMGDLNSTVSHVYESGEIQYIPSSI